MGEGLSRAVPQGSDDCRVVSGVWQQLPQGIPLREVDSRRQPGTPNEGQRLQRVVGPWAGAQPQKQKLRLQPSGGEGGDRVHQAPLIGHQAIDRRLHESVSPEGD